jgi:hypothetical protein
MICGTKFLLFIITVLSVCVSLVIEPRAFHMLGKPSTAKLHSQPYFILILGQGLTKLPRLALSLLCSPDRPQTFDSLTSASQVSGISGMYHYSWLLLLLLLLSMTLWHTPSVPGFGRWRLEDHKFKGSLGHIARHCLTTKQNKNFADSKPKCFCQASGL